MKTVKTAITLSALLFAGLVSAGSVTPDLETDLIYGNDDVKASRGEAYIASSNDVVHDLSTDVIYGGVELKPSPFTAPERVAGQHDLSTDLIYGS